MLTLKMNGQFIILLNIQKAHLFTNVPDSGGMQMKTYSMVLKYSKANRDTDTKIEMSSKMRGIKRRV